MELPETVTLIDLEGKPIPLRENVPPHYFNGEYAHIVDFIWQFKDKDYRIYIGNSIKVGEAVKHYDNLLPLVLFLQDQLTFIRNEMWETLAIYQATLGRYWEVPWYETPNEGVLTQGEWYQYLNEDLNCNSAWYRKGCELGYDNMWEVEGFFNSRLRNEDSDYEDSKECCRRLSNASAIKPSIKDFCKNYPDVFSKLTPWKGE